MIEFRRVLRPGGLAAVSDDDLATVVMSPDRPELELGPRLFEQAVAHEGGNARYSRHLRTRDELEALLDALREWGELPDAFAAWLYCGALGWID